MMFFCIHNEAGKDVRGVGLVGSIKSLGSRSIFCIKNEPIREVQQMEDRMKRAQSRVDLPECPQIFVPLNSFCSTPKFEFSVTRFRT
jgi:hypothetical protein